MNERFPELKNPKKFRFLGISILSKPPLFTLISCLRVGVDSRDYFCFPSLTSTSSLPPLCLFFFLGLQNYYFSERVSIKALGR